MAVAYREAPSLPSQPPPRRLSQTNNQSHLLSPYNPTLPPSNQQSNSPSNAHINGQTSSQTVQPMPRLPSPPAQATIVQLPSQSHHHQHRSNHHSNHHSTHRTSRRSSQQSYDSAIDQSLALALQHEFENAESERAIRIALTRQFAELTDAGDVNQVDLSMLTLAEAQQAVEIAMKVRAQKKSGLLGRLRGKLKKKPTHLAANSIAQAVNGRSSPSPSPSPNQAAGDHIDVDNMSYEELLALGEMIGEVKSKGMSEDMIDRLPIVFFESNKQNSHPTEHKSNNQPASQPIAQVGEPDHFIDDSDDELKSHESINPALHGHQVNQPINLSIYEPKVKKKGFFSRLKKSKSHDQSISQAASQSSNQSSQSPNPTSQSSHQPHITRQPSLSRNQSISQSANNQCSICLEPYQNGDALKFLPCFHRAHAEEMNHWLSINATCPVCKEKVVV